MTDVQDYLRERSAATAEVPPTLAQNRRTGTIFLIVGVVVLLIGGGLLVERAAFNARAETATGTVVERNYVRPTSSTGGGTGAYRPTFIYTDVSGNEQRGRAHIANKDFDWPKGAEVEIRYDPNNPDRVRPVVPLVQSFLIHAALLIFGTAFVAAGWLIRRMA